MTSVEHHPLVGQRLRSAGAAAGDARTRIAVGRDDDWTSIAVRNTGVEIAARGDRTRLYGSPGQRTLLLSGQRPWGSGSGLARTKRLVEMHGGTIDVESELGGGTTFTVRIPVA